MNVREVLQRIMDAQWSDGEIMRRACRSGAAAWAVMVQQSGPPAPRLVGRREYERCLRTAQEVFTRIGVQTLRVIPTWSCTAFLLPGLNWVRTHGVQVGGARVQLPDVVGIEDPPSPIDAALTAQAAVWDVARVVPIAGTVFTPSPRRLRVHHGLYGVVDLRVYEILEVVAHPGSPLPSPTRTVPATGTWHMPRVTGLSNCELRELRSASICFDEKGGLIWP